VVLAHLHKYDWQIQCIWKGLLQYLPQSVLVLWNSYDIEEVVWGKVDIDVEKLREEVEESLEDNQKTWFWECVQNMTIQQRSKLLLFATGRSKLPVGKFYIRSADSIGAGGDGAMPSANTCSFKLRMPKYSTQQIMMAQLCKALEEFH